MAKVTLPVLRGPAHSGRPAAPDAVIDRDRLASDLRSRIDGEVRFGRHERMLYATDASIYQVEPIGVVVPRTTDEAADAVRCCAEHGVPILPRGGGTSLAGQAVNAAVVIDFSRWCNRILSIDPAMRLARVEPGVELDTLNAALAPHGLMFGPDVASAAQASVGGMIGNNSAGAYSIAFGRTVEHLAAVDAILADGSRLSFHEGAASADGRLGSLTDGVASVVRPLAEVIRRRFPRIVRHVDGYNLDLVLDGLERSTPGTFDRVNLAHLLCGSEGTLALTALATLRLVERPRSRGLAIVAVPSVDEALARLAAIISTGPSAVEMLDDVVLRTASRNIEYRRYVELLPQPAGRMAGAVLYVEYFAGDAAELQARLDVLSRLVAPALVQRYTDPDAMTRAWRLRRAGEPLLHTIPGLRKPITFIEDTAVDPRRLPEFVHEFRRIVARHGTTAAYYAHASVGCLHIRPLINPRDTADLAAMESIAAEVTDLIVRYGGAISGEHGDGRLRSHLLERYFGAEITAAFRRIKAIFDPRNLLNPGNIVAPAPMTADLRVKPAGSAAVVPRTRTFFRYDREEGFAAAIELCNGAGFCRRMAGGTMCPSYRALRDERHSTRGRANALRLAITGQFAGGGGAGVAPRWTDRDTIDTLDLCLSCKACKSECPSNVDLARLKAEYTAQWYAAGARIPWRTRRFANVRSLNRLGSALHPLANGLLRLPPVRAAVNAAMGIDPRRSLPRFGPPLRRWFASRIPPRLPENAPKVVYFPDCFTSLSEPHIGRAVVQVLDGLQYRVIMPRIGCCGRARISLGLLGDAVAQCRATAAALMRIVEDHGAEAVVVAEPSCASAIKDDWLDLELGLDPASLRALAERTMLIEDFLASRARGSAALPRIKGDAPVLLHGHCHQKALWGMEPTVSLLRRRVGDRLRVLDSGCCGMAGSFGYTRGHFDLSMAIANLTLVPAIQAEPEAVLLANGTSCRHQIRDATGRQALHPIELLAPADQVDGALRR